MCYSDLYATVSSGSATNRDEWTDGQTDRYFLTCDTSKYFNIEQHLYKHNTKCLCIQTLNEENPQNISWQTVLFLKFSYTYS